MSELDGQGAQGGGYTPSQSDPVDLAAAFQMVRDLDKGTAQQAVADQGDTEAAGVGDAGPGGAEQRGVPGGFAEEPGQDGRQAAAAYGQQGGGDPAGGPTAYQPSYDYQAIGKGIAAELGVQAQKYVVQQFQQNGVKPVDISDIFQRNEDGSVTFVNPDDPSKPFQSRAEAQSWVDSMNKQIQREYSRQVDAAHRELIRQSKPAMDLVAFAPTYDAMDPATRGIFDELIEPYALQNAQGQVVGFSCNLKKMHQQAIRLGSRFGATADQYRKEAAQAKQQASQPAMDMKTGGSMSGNDKEPTTIEEAWVLMNAQKKGNQ